MQDTAILLAFWHKQWGGARPESAGRELDGRTHDGMPTHVSGAMPEGRTLPTITLPIFRNTLKGPRPWKRNRSD